MARRKMADLMEEALEISRKLGVDPPAIALLTPKGMWPIVVEEVLEDGFISEGVCYGWVNFEAIKPELVKILLEKAKMVGANILTLPKKE